MLLTADELSKDFYRSKEMIAYHQSAYITEYLIENYGIEKLESFWQTGFASFESLYGLSFDSMITQLNEKLLEEYPESPNINWGVLKEGCK